MLFRRRQFDRDLNDELLGHIAEREAHYLREGVAPDDARRRARLELGNPAVIHEQSRDVWIVRWLDALTRDARIALRGIRAAPGTNQD